MSSQTWEDAREIGIILSDPLALEKKNLPSEACLNALLNEARRNGKDSVPVTFEQIEFLFSFCQSLNNLFSDMPDKEMIERAVNVLNLAHEESKEETCTLSLSHLKILFLIPPMIKRKENHKHLQAGKLLG